MKSGREIRQRWKGGRKEGRKKVAEMEPTGLRRRQQTRRKGENTESKKWKRVSDEERKGDEERKTPNQRRQPLELIVLDD